MTKQNRLRYLVLSVLFVIYIVCLFYITLFSRSCSIIRSISFNLLRSYRLWFSGNKISGRAIIQNIVLFVPCGYLLAARIIGKKQTKNRIFISIIIGVLITIFIEGVQYYTGRGTADIDDLLNNTFGVIIGSVLYLGFCNLDQKSGNNVLRLIVAILVVVSEIIGCYYMAGITGGTSPNVDQFDFRVCSVDTTDGVSFSGICRTYYMPTPDYTIYLKSDKTLSTETAIEGKSFTANADVPVTDNYEILIKFRGFPRVSTSTFIRDGRVMFVDSNELDPPEDSILEGAVLKAYSSIYDTYVFQKQDSLIWLIGCEIDDSTEIISHIDTNEPEKLPDIRIQYGFDNIGFRATSNEMEPIEHYRVFQKDLPDSYNITGVSVGLSSKGKVLWSHRFRTETVYGD